MTVGLPVTDGVRFEDHFSALSLVSEDLLSRSRHFQTREYAGEASFHHSHCAVHEASHGVVQRSF